MQDPKFKNSVNGLYNRMEETEEEISEQKNRMMQITKSEQREKYTEKNGNMLKNHGIIKFT
jgi:hypothetical protein